jgi:hypothetical protein
MSWQANPVQCKRGLNLHSDDVFYLPNLPSTQYNEFLLSNINWLNKYVRRSVLTKYKHYSTALRMLHSANYRLLNEIRLWRGWIIFTACTIIQIMNVYECNGKNIFMRWKMECSIQRGDSRVEWNISSFTEWKYSYHCTKKHSLFVNTKID